MGDVQAYDPFYDRVEWSLEFAWLPHVCELTGAEIWFEYGYKGTAGKEERWHSKIDHIIWQIKGN